jgi:hypothetical protein
MTLDHAFEGIAILCFYPSNNLFQGHCINKLANTSPFSLAGKLDPEHVDPQHNDCMEPDDFYNVLIQPHAQTETVSLLLRRPKHNDVGGLSTHEHEQEINDGYKFLFETNQFFSGNTALTMKHKYFPTSNLGDDPEVIVCIGDIKFYNTNKK